MDPPGWANKVYRLRRVPSHIANSPEVAKLLGDALEISPDDVIVYSLACTLNSLELPPPKVATLQLKSLPQLLTAHPNDKEWKIRLSETLDDYLLLDTKFLGMTVLNDVDMISHHTDCIAISGLASHPFGSWQPHGQDKTFMWIRDEAARLISGTRMILYGYDSELAKSTSFQGLSDISLGLSHELKNGGWNLPPSKQLVFLAHSLGGIILKDAIVDIAGNKIYAPILNKVKGAIMFGVPNLGMNQSHLMMMTQGQPNNTLIQDLSRDNGSYYLRNLNTRFDGLAFLKRTTIFWAYETKESATAVKQPGGNWIKNGPPEVLVNKDSATAYRNTNDKFITIPIDKDHSGIVKFSRGDKDLETILHILSEICGHSDPASQPSPARKADASSTLISASFQELIAFETKMYEELWSPELHARIEQVEDRFENTFDWIYDMSSFLNWLQDGTGLFWINGKPGSGKSTLMKYIYQSKLTWDLLQNWKRLSPDVTQLQAGFFFHYRGTSLQKSLEGLLRSLIIQILDQLDSFKKRWNQIQKEVERLIEKETQKEIESDMKKDMEEGFSQEIKKRIEDEIQKQAESHRNEDDILVAARLLKDLKAFRNTPTGKHLVKVVYGHHFRGQSQKDWLERLLRSLLYQDVLKMDVILFFDALDEYDGRPDVIGRFIHRLVQLSTPISRVKICFSSRPWKALLAQFSNIPTICLHDYTQDDIARYASGKLKHPGHSGWDMLMLLPQITTKANGVFVWVKLAISEIFRLFEDKNNPHPIQDVEQMLNKLPDDLFNFYELIVERIADTHRRYTFALLELIIRQEQPQGIDDIWRAVRISNCFTQDLATTFLRSHVYTIHPSPEVRQEMKSDIFAWSGGLVEINGTEAQLMHQTVLEYIQSLHFKRHVLGGLDTLVKENGHSFHLKALMTTVISETHRWDLARYLSQSKAGIHQKSIHYHSRQSELTTGESQLRFLETVPETTLRLLSDIPEDHNDSPTAPGILLFASCFGLALCLRSWVEKNPGGLNLICGEAQPPPLLSNLLHKWDFDDNVVATAVLLLENGFDPNQDHEFFAALLAQEWADNMGEKQQIGKRHQTPIPRSALRLLITLALKHGQDPNVLIKPQRDVLIWEEFGLGRDKRPLHMASPELAAELIAYGADPNCPDTSEKSPMDWVLSDNYISTTAKNLDDPDSWVYQMIKLLLKHGAVIKPESLDALTERLDSFSMIGLDVSIIRQNYHLKGIEMQHSGNKTKSGVSEQGQGGDRAEEKAPGSGEKRVKKVLIVVRKCQQRAREEVRRVGERISSLKL